jgi:DeoR/GlpR family transcriptional regulator of sugar metabolism
VKHGCRLFLALCFHFHFLEKLVVGKPHRLTERRQAIVAALEEAGQLSVAELCKRFDVTDVTIRADLQALSEQGMVLRVRGGAMATTALPELSYDVRQQLSAAQKARIGKMAATFVHNGDAIVIDASTTAQAITPYLQHLAELTVITNSLKVAMALLAYPQIDVLMPGVSLRRESISLVGTIENTSVADIHIRIGFFGARGFAIEEGMTDVNLDEVRTKRSLVARCKQVVGVLDSRKWGQIATATFASLDQINTIITDSDAPESMVEEVQARGVEVILV